MMQCFMIRETWVEFAMHLKVEILAPTFLFVALALSQ